MSVMFIEDCRQIDYKFACILFNNYAVYLEQPSRHTSDALNAIYLVRSLSFGAEIVYAYIKIHP